MDDTFRLRAESNIPSDNHSMLKDISATLLGKEKFEGKGKFKWTLLQHSLLVADVMERGSLSELSYGEAIYLGKLYALLYYPLFTNNELETQEVKTINIGKIFLKSKILNNRSYRDIEKAFDKAMHFSNTLAFNIIILSKYNVDDHIKSCTDFNTVRMLRKFSNTIKEEADVSRLQDAYINEVKMTLKILGLHNEYMG